MFLSILCLWFISPSSTSDNIFPKLHSTRPVEITTHKFYRRYRVCYPPFEWSLPLGLTNVTLPLFWKQPENKRHFLDTNISEHCGVFRLVSNGKVQLPFQGISNETHFINTRTPPLRAAHPDHTFLLLLTGHWGHYFQHFFDNLGPQIALALDVLGCEHSNLTVVADIAKSDFPNVPKLWNRIGFNNVITSRAGKVYSAENLAMIESCPRVHPHFFKKLRELFKLPVYKATKIIWISRKPSNSYFAQRFILNQDVVITQLRKRYGKDRVVIFDHTKYDLEGTVRLFASAKIIIGSHGGGLYNQFFAPTNCTIVEIMPVRFDGLYPGQQTVNEIPQFSHMAVWSNSLLIGQKFWRYYEITRDANFNLSIKEFIDFLNAIPAFAN